MKATKLYDRLENDFIFPGLTDEWANYMEPVHEFLTQNFKERSMGSRLGAGYMAVYATN